MSFFEPSRKPFERQRLGITSFSVSGTIEWIHEQPIWLRIAGAVGLAVYVGGAAALCSLSLAASVWTGALTALVMSTLLAFHRLAWPIVSGLCFGLLMAIGTLALVLPAIVFVVLGFWVIVSLPLWLYRI